MPTNTFRQHSDRVVSVAFTSNNQFIASASYDSTVRIWNPLTGKVSHAFFVESINASSKISFSQSDRVITLGNGYDSLVSWHIDTGEKTQILKGISGYTSGTAFSPDGKLFANSSATGEIKIWKVKTGELQDTVANKSIVTTIVFDNSNSFLAGIDITRKIQLWNLKSKKLLNQWQGFRTVGLSPNAKFIATNDCSTIKVFDLQTNKKIYTFEGKFNYLQALLFSFDNKILVSADVSSNEIIVWDLETNKTRQTMHSPQVYSIAMSPNQRMLASAGFDNTVRIWEIQ